MLQVGEGAFGEGATARWSDLREMSLLAEAVGFDVARDGTVLYTNGSAIERLTPGGEAERVCTGQRIEGVVALG